MLLHAMYICYEICTHSYTWAQHNAKTTDIPPANQMKRWYLLKRDKILKPKFIYIVEIHWICAGNHTTILIKNAHNTSDVSDETTTATVKWMVLDARKYVCYCH